MCRRYAPASDCSQDPAPSTLHAARGHHWIVIFGIESRNPEGYISNPWMFERMIAEMHNLLDRLHHRSPELQIGVTAMWPQYVDVLDGDTDLALLLRSPVNPPGNWDFINLMTYSSYYPSDWAVTTSTCTNRS